MKNKCEGRQLNNKQINILEDMIYNNRMAGMDICKCDRERILSTEFDNAGTFKIGVAEYIQSTIDTTKHIDEKKEMEIEVGNKRLNTQDEVTVLYNNDRTSIYSPEKTHKLILNEMDVSCIQIMRK